MSVQFLPGGYEFRFTRARVAGLVMAALGVAGLAPSSHRVA
jgi:hypothetical protein